MMVRDNDNKSDNNKVLWSSVIPLKDTIIYPGLVRPLFVGRKKSLFSLNESRAKDNKIFLVNQKNKSSHIVEYQDLYEYGIFVHIVQVVERQNNTVQVLIEALQRGRILSFDNSGEGYIAQIELLEDQNLDINDPKILASVKDIMERFQTYLTLTNNVSSEVLNSINELKGINQILYHIVAFLDLSAEEVNDILIENDIYEKITKVAILLTKINEILIADEDIKNRIKEKMEENKELIRNNYLNTQLDAIKEELGSRKTEGDDASGASSSETTKKKSEVEIFTEKAKEIKFSEEAQEKFDDELKKLVALPAMSSEAAVIRNYLQYLLDIPWKHYKDLCYDLNQAQEILDKEHYGLEKVKEKIIEYLAVQARLKKVKGSILCLVGPPGVGKTSLARSIANAMGRSFVKVCLGGIRDEAEIRGHRRTYLGAMPGKIMQSMKRAKYSNPLILLDEIDKMSYDHRGDPASALLEVLDPEQNHIFNDHYIEVNYDLSDVMFVTTSNSLNFSYPLRDRMEIVTLSGYTEDEKLNITKRHLIEKLLKEIGLEAEEFNISDTAILKIIREYTREAGIRELERQIATVMRKILCKILNDKKTKSVSITVRNVKHYLGVSKFSYGQLEEEDLVGAVTGLAYTEVGGDILSIEVIKSEGAKESGGTITATGKLGDVMKESVKATFNLFKSESQHLGVRPEDFAKANLHIHFPEGAVPKDGPSAGVAIYTAIVSRMTNIPVRCDVAMTGEISLKGKVLPIGGLKEKLLAASRSGVKTVIIPKKNKKDLSEIAKNVTDNLNIITVERIDEVIKIALTKEPKAVK